MASSSQLEAWYEKVHSRRVDLVGDYAGNELFLVEGDSLLLHAFSDPNLDFDDGFQLLHATYNVENFLKKLVVRGCNFHIGFIEDHKTLCIPPNATHHRQKYLLARTAIIRHLEANLPEKNGQVTIKKFTSVLSKEFLEYLQETGVYFVMLHDGAYTVRKDGGEEEKQARNAKTHLRFLVHWLVQKGYNVALMNDLEFVDTKIMTMVLEEKHLEKTMEFSKENGIEEVESIEAGSFDDVIEIVQKFADENDTELSERDAITLLSLAQLLKQNKIDATLASVFLLHTASLDYIPLASRRLSATSQSAEMAETIDNFTQLACQALFDSNVQDFMDVEVGECDVGDLVDARLFFALQAMVKDKQLLVDNSASSLSSKYESLVAVLKAASGNDDLLPIKMVDLEIPAKVKRSVPSPSAEFVMPFQDVAFDKHLAPIHLSTDSNAAVHQSATTTRIFQELTHWHNARRPLATKGHIEVLNKWALKRNQRFMAEMIAYAASLTNANGKSLDPEIIIAGGSGKTSKLAILPGKTDAKSKKSEAAIKKEEAAAKKEEAAASKKGGQAKKSAQTNKKGGKAAALEAAAAIKANKSDQEETKYFSHWDTHCKEVLQVEEDPEEQYAKTEQYFQRLVPKVAAIVGTEVELFKIGSLFELWTRIRKSPSAKTDPKQHATVQGKENGEGYVALIWDAATRLSRGPKEVTKTVGTLTNEVLAALKLPALTFPTSTNDRKLPFTIGALRKAKIEKLDLSLSQASMDFQLNYCGPYFDRSVDAAPDARVPFQPDAWQRKVLDAIDARKSMLVVAPTSAGKTFISFYAMKQVLEATDGDVLVYVAPTKALVNQIAAEVQARFTKSYKHAGKSVWGIHTRDYRINNPAGCQILVTVPHILQIMLLAPSNAMKKDSWANRVKSIIFDEVHCIGQADDGLIWEQLLLLAPCPIIALSATVGNPTELAGWLADTQKAIGNELVMVQHKTRYSDLRKFVYMPPKKFAFKPLKHQAKIPIPGLDGSNSFAFVHPVASLVDRTRGMPEDLTLEARDCLLLYNAMAKVQTKKFVIDASLNPAKALPAVTKKADVLKWEAKLKAVLQQWMKDANSPFEEVLEILSKPVAEHKLGLSDADDDASARSVNADSLSSTTLPLLLELHQQDALPAIIFNYDRSYCEKLAQQIVNELKECEDAWKESSATWKKKIAAFQVWTEAREKAAEKAKKAPTASKTKKKKKGGDDEDGGDDGEEERGSKADSARDKADSGGSSFSSFDPDAPQEGFHFADFKKLLPSELIEYQKVLRWRGVPEWLVAALDRGVGVHHSGMNRKYRQVCEILFRKGFMRVVVATGTLALGINMPCKTVVFSGDSVFLTALNFRQAAGRAGRRGFDVLGNVVFQGINFNKVCRLLSSRLPDLNGHFPITTSLVLRLFTLVNETQHSAYATNAINALLSQPRLYLGGAEAKDTVLHHLRFSIEYLRRQSLLSESGVPLNFAGAVSHLSYMEDAGFAFHALLKDGYFHQLCSKIYRKPQAVLLELMLTMAHLFCRQVCRQADEEFIENVVKRSPSIVFLPAMPKEAEVILRSHNDQTLDIFRSYVKTFVDQHIKDSDHTLPLTTMEIKSEADGAKFASFLPQSLPDAEIRSPFVALSGHGDEFKSIGDLCRTVRAGVFLEESVIPHVKIHPQETDAPLNAYLYDFFKHGDVSALEKGNGIRRGEVWFLLNDFSLVLATIVTSLSNFMKLTPDSDMDMIDLQGSGDKVEEAAGSDTDSDAESEHSGVSSVDYDDASTLPTSVGGTSVADGEGVPSWASDNGAGMKKILKAFKMLQAEYNAKFMKMWA
ncbi:hypothetical protein EG327_007041 [Venturia inaequalis]|uniref:P-loop containing nucleoside triphosphate hydrolase protein n=1 Tax=Venturia inaequalis TaxID=5025 RepID=A0A8H3UZ26_VENIN|nr:hypothetical protein EG327_007041 [Venturia inaequalis]